MNIGNKKIITIIGRGHSGTRLIAKAMRDSGVFIGDNLNESYDKKPFQPIYDLVNIIIKNYLKIYDNYNVDISKMKNNVPDFAEKMINYYLFDILKSNNNIVGWKLPETVFILPWLVQLYPNIKYILWFRNPLANKWHISDRFIRNNGIHTYQEKSLMSSYISWKIQYDIIMNTEIENKLLVKFEDYILNHNHETDRVNNFLNKEIRNQNVNKDKIKYDNANVPDFLKESMTKLNYM